ncbi:MAG: hypothetical protein A2015_16790 [Spirochaetes bacterium GWF1_31_7]|nr:MAG: hypothetical protein A2Y30_14155 [Spirochaetes bacterium GWE1_32_154]OHD50100.1 MAG: hypothetical protein A2Y29_12200 [Spirochaetes bacterium GWE2_31_10]OHD52413.1 MAG: hypothetical protein A2015_16790 [Spirochaetes bacterium GWF1_31_7]HBD96057.1 hypothetical protein [Spirochaetia bacterium]HBI38569.1 hypothetical protein [Spirochaetia bacterium]
MSISYTENKKPWDLIVIGGGPIGLSAAKVAADKNLNVILLEKGNTCGFEIRAETISHDPIIDTIWGENFLDSSIVISYQRINILHSPLDKFNSEVTMIETPNSYHWHDFIGKMVQIISDKSNVTISLNTEVHNVILPAKPGHAVDSVSTNKGIVYGKTILDCSGWNTRIGRQNGIDIDYSKIVDPIIKARYSNFPYDTIKNFQSFFITAGSIVPDSPPCIVVMFPNAKHEVEIGALFLSDFGPDGRLIDGRKYSNEFLIDYFENIKQKAHGFSDLMKPLQKEIEFFTGMPAKKVLHNPMILPGLALCGDAAGFMDPRTYSGLIMGMYSAEFWANVAVKKSRNILSSWNENSMNSYNTLLHKQEFFIQLKNYHIRMTTAKDFAYSVWRNAENYNKNWDFFVSMYNINNKFDAMKITNEEYKKIIWTEQVSCINAICSSFLALQPAENKILSFLTISKNQLSEDNWSKFTAGLLYDSLFTKFQGTKDLNALFDLLGTVSRVEYAIKMNKKSLIVTFLNSNAIKMCTIHQITELLFIMLKGKPFLLKEQSKVLEIIKITKENSALKDFNEIIKILGGKDKIINSIWYGKFRNKLSELI